MSLQAMTWVFNQAPVTDPATLLVLLALADHADRDGRNAFPSRETIATYARLSVRSVSTKLAALEEGGVIALGDQQKVAHLPANRRPKVYDIQLGVKDLPPIGSGYPAGEKDASPQEEGSGVKDTTSRGEVQSSSGVKRSAHKPKLLTQKEEQGGVVPEVPHHAVRKKWQPDAAAVTEAKQAVRLTDIGLSIASYEVWCIRHGRKMSNAEWLSWILRDEKEAIDKERREREAKRKHKTWADVDD